MRDAHENDSNFSVTCELCGRTYKKWDSLKKHLHRDHGGECANVRMDTDTGSEDITTHDGLSTESAGGAHQLFESFLPTSEQMNDERVDQKWESARFLLKVTEEHSISYSGVDSLCTSVQKLVDDVCCRIKDNVQTLLPNTLSSCEKEAVLCTCDTPAIFDGLTSRYLREKFYREKFHYAVSCMRRNALIISSYRILFPF